MLIIDELKLEIQNRSIITYTKEKKKNSVSFLLLLLLFLFFGGECKLHLNLVFFN